GLIFFGQWASITTISRRQPMKTCASCSAARRREANHIRRICSRNRAAAFSRCKRSRRAARTGRFKAYSIFLFLFLFLFLILILILFLFPILFLFFLTGQV